MTYTEPRATDCVSNQAGFAHHAAALRAEQMEDLLASFNEDAWF